MATDYLKYSMQLLENANENRSYTNQFGYRVSASILKRMEEDTPLNEKEGAAFYFIRENLPLIEVMAEFAGQAMRAGKVNISIGFVVERCRWEVEVEIRSRDEFRINDHHTPYIARLLNESMGFPLFTCRGVIGEPGHRSTRPIDWDNPPSEPVGRSWMRQIGMAQP